MEKTQPTDNDIRKAFATYSAVLREGDANSKLNASGEMLSLLSNYLRQQIDDIDTKAILLLLEELANIGEGNEPEFIKKTKSNAGRPIKLGDNIRYASIVAAIEILAANGNEFKEAIQKASKLSGYDSTRLRQIRKEFRENKRPDAAVNFMWKQIRIQTDQRLEPTTYAAALIDTAMKKRG